VRAACRSLAVPLALSGALVVGSAAAAPFAFAPAEHFPTGSSIGPGPGAVTTVAIDVDGDSDVDVVATDWFGDGPLVLRNDGGGRFGAPTVIAGADGVGALASGDLDGHGQPDLVGRDSGGVLPMLAKGDGTFEVGDHLSVSSNAQQSVSVMDANGDGHLDVVTPESLGIRTLLGHGDGSFSSGPMSPLTGLLADLKLADLDGDPVADLLVADATPLTQRVVALRGNGDGSFVESGSGTVGYGPEAVMAGDLDGDHRDDAVSVDSFSAFNDPPSFSITVLLGDGSGGFSSSQTYPTGDGPVSGALADFDADGALDVAVSAVGSSDVTVYAGDGAGGLEHAGRLAVVNQPQTPVGTDLDGDDRIDIAVPGVGQLSVLRNLAPDGSGGGAEPPPTRTGPTVPPGTLPATGWAGPVGIAALALCATLIANRVRAPAARDGSGGASP
jgi:hypothetical protein